MKCMKSINYSQTAVKYNELFALLLVQDDYFLERKKIDQKKDCKIQHICYIAISFKG